MVELLDVFLHFLGQLVLFFHLLEGELSHAWMHARHGEDERILVRVAEIVGEGYHLEDGEMIAFQILSDRCEFGQVDVERVEPVRDLIEERISLQLGEGTHVDVSARHLPFAHLLDLVGDARLVHPFFPFRVAVFRILGFVETEFRIVELLGALKHFGDDLLAHLLVYLACLTGDEQLHLDGLKIFPEAFLFAEQGESGGDFRVERHSLAMLADGDDHSYDGTLAHLEIIMPVSVEQEAELTGVEDAEQAQGSGAHHDGQVVGIDQKRLQDGIGFLAFRVRP